MSMAASQRASARFFAAFYRWNCYTHVQRRCALDSRAQQRKPQCLRITKNFSTVRANKYTAEPSATPQEEAEAHDTPQNGKSLNSKIERIDEILDEPEQQPDPKRPGTQPILDRQPTSPTSTPTNPQDLRASVLHLMRHVPHPVVVLTAASPSSSHGLPSQPLGIAVSSFNTVTLDPPTISFNIRRPSQTLSAIHADGGRFRVHFLAPRAKSARIAGLFTQGNHEEAYRLRREIMGMSLDLEVGRGSGGGGGGRAAKIVDECVVACLECVLVKEVEVGDHVIAVAGVERIEARENNEPVLSYVRGKYVHEGVDLLGEIESEIVAEEVEDKKGSKG